MRLVLVSTAAGLLFLSPTWGSGVASETVFAPEAKIAAGRCVSAAATATSVRLDNRGSNGPVTYEVARVRRAQLRSSYVTVAGGSVQQRAVRTRRARVRIIVRAFDAQVASRLLRARYCRHGATVGAVTANAATLTVVNRTSRPASFTVETSAPDSGPQAWHVDVPAQRRRSVQVGVVSETPTRVVVRHGERLLLERLLTGTGG